MRRFLPEGVRRRLRSVRGYLALTSDARRERRRDRAGLPAQAPTHGEVVDAGLAWLVRAQAESVPADGGIARHWSFLTGWSASYPETTGYIVPTLLRNADRPGHADAREVALRALDFLVATQFPEGGIAGGMIGQRPRVPVAFNTGQVLLGFAVAARLDPGRYGGPMTKAAQWLVDVQDADGSWRRNPSPFAAGGTKTYDTHVAWGLLEAARVSGVDRFADAARANILWAMDHQHENGWFRDCCLGRPEQPLTHTIGYALRGIIEGYHYFRDEDMLRTAVRTADALGRALGEDGFLPGRLDSAWVPRSKSACLTGTSQIALCWLLLHRITGDDRYLDLARRANTYVRRTIRTDGPPEVRGGVKGSFPVWGGYGPYQMLSWACKFTVDAHQLELVVSEPTEDHVVW